jgi:hypothetical protein
LAAKEASAAKQDVAAVLAGTEPAEAAARVSPAAGTLAAKEDPAANLTAITRDAAATAPHTLPAEMTRATSATANNAEAAADTLATKETRGAILAGEDVVKVSPAMTAVAQDSHGKLGDSRLEDKLNSILATIPPPDHSISDPSALVALLAQTSPKLSVRAIARKTGWPRQTLDYVRCQAEGKLAGKKRRKASKHSMTKRLGAFIHQLKQPARSPNGA